jgi:vacuolar protein sorting-associated protein 13A/C
VKLNIGTAIGMTGLIVKPITGVFDGASKSAEGLTNTATYFDDKPNCERIQNIRAFYEVQRLWKFYLSLEIL